MVSSVLNGRFLQGLRLSLFALIGNSEGGNFRMINFYKISFYLAQSLAQFLHRGEILASRLKTCVFLLMVFIFDHNFEIILC